jgi:hypothetical protein
MRLMAARIICGRDKRVVRVTVQRVVLFVDKTSQVSSMLLFRMFIAVLVFIRTPEWRPVSNQYFCPRGHFRIDPKMPLT